MNKDSIVQFICFSTELDREDFISIWKTYANQLTDDKTNILLNEAVALKSKNKFKYVSRHESVSSEFLFAFIKESRSASFSEKAKVVQAGGYTPEQIQCEHSEVKGDVKVIAFIDHDETELGFYHRQTYRHLNIYQAYYENCAYGYIMEFFLDEQDAPLLIEQLKTRSGVEVALYKEYSLFHSSKKTLGSLM